MRLDRNRVDGERAVAKRLQDPGCILVFEKTEDDVEGPPGRDVSPKEIRDRPRCQEVPVTSAHQSPKRTVRMAVLNMGSQ